MKRLLLLLALPGCSLVSGVDEYSVGDAGPDPGDAAGADASSDAALEASDGGGAESAVDGGSCACVTDLSNAGLSDFWIAFDIQTTEKTEPMAVLAQRASCDSAKIFWEVYLAPNGAYGLDSGAVYFQTGGGGYPVDTPSTQRAVNDGQKHHVVISRTGASSSTPTLTLTVDGSGAPQGGHVDPLGAVPPLVMGTDPCPYAPFNGELTNLCMTVGCEKR